MSKISNKISPSANCWSKIGVWSTVEEKCSQLADYVHCRNCPVFTNIGHSVFEKSAPSGYLSEWRKDIAAKAIKDDENRNSVLVFRVSNEWFALPAKVLNEVANEREIHRIPRNLNRYISGIVNINGEIKICYSLNTLLDLNAVIEHDNDENKHIPRRLIVVEFAEIDYVFLVDEVIGLHWYSDSDVVPVPATLEAENSLLLLGSINQFGHQVAIFDVKELQKNLEGAAS